MKKLLLVLFLLCLSSPAWADWCDDISAEVCFTFDTDSGSTATDLSSNGNDGTAQNNATLLSSGCHEGGCWTFDGNGDSLALDSTITLSNSVSNSICFWMNGDDISGANTNLAMGDLSDVGNLINIFSQAGLHAQIKDSAEDGDIFSKDSGDWSDGTWIHTCFINDGTNWTMYYDGSAQSDTEASGTNNLAITDIGHGSSGVSNGFDGEIDEVVVFSNKVLDSTDINDIMDNGLVQDSETWTPKVIMF